MLDSLGAEERLALVREAAASLRADPEFRQTLIGEARASIFQELFRPKVQFHILGGGRLPKQASEGAVGFDVYARAIVHKTEMEPNGVLRRTIFDFTKAPTDDPGLIARTELRPARDGEPGKFEWAYWLNPEEDVLIGAGCVIVVPMPMEIQVRPRSGLATKHGILLSNGPGTIDPDYRGEAGVLLYNTRKERFPIFKNLRVAQFIFNYTSIPDFDEVEDYTELSATVRGTGGFGSTGLH